MGIRSLLAELAAFPVRIMRIDKKQVVMADLPGLKKEEVRVELTDSVLVIEAEPNREWRTFLSQGWTSGNSAPDGARIHRAKAQLKNGVLTVSLPVASSRSGRRVSVEEISILSLNNLTAAKRRENLSRPYQMKNTRLNDVIAFGAHPG